MPRGIYFMCTPQQANGILEMLLEQRKFTERNS